MGNDISTQGLQRKGSDSSIEYQLLEDDVKPRQIRRSVIVTGGLVGGPVGQITAWKPHAKFRKEKIC